MNAMHITASVFINDNESGLHADGRKPGAFALGNRRNPRIAPIPLSHYRHNRTGEDNGDAHLKRKIMGREVVVAITEGQLDFGPWERIFVGQPDG